MAQAASAISPSPNIIADQYIAITATSFGTTTAGGGLGGGRTVYYPTIDFYIRVIFGVYGTHSYLCSSNACLALNHV